MIAGVFSGAPLQEFFLLFLVLQVSIVVFQSLRPKYRRLHGWRSPIVSLRNAFLPSLPTQVFLAVALLVALFPVWALSVAIERWTGFGRLAAFLTIVPIVYVAYLVMGFTGWGRRVEAGLGWRAGRPTVSFEPIVGQRAPKRVAVIGAGMAGLVATKELKEQGHEVVVFERAPRWGGVWAQEKLRGGSAWNTTVTSTGAMNSTLSDCPVDVLNEDNGDTPMHFTRQQFFAMLAGYESRHAVFHDGLRLDTEVERLDPLDGDRWRVVSRHRIGGTQSIDEFDALTICTGLNQDRRLPTVPGSASFTGEQLHLDDIGPGDIERLASARLVVVGTGESASDLVEELAAAGASDICVSHRSSTISLPRNYTTIPPDHTENRITYGGPMFTRWGILLSSSFLMMLPLVKPTRIHPPSMINWIKLFRPWKTIRALPSLMGSVNVTKSDGLWRQLDAKTAWLAKGLASIDGDEVEFVDGRRHEADAIVYCTGYATDHSFLLPIGDDAPDVTANSASSVRPSVGVAVRDLYKLTVSPDYGNLAFIGFARGQIGAITLSSEIQARWWARVVTGDLALPPEPAMRRHIVRCRRYSRRFVHPTRTTMTFANSIARNDLGCEPDMFRLLKEDRRTWLRVLCGPISNSHYRLHGVGAKPDLARQQLDKPGAMSDSDYIDSVDLIYNIIPLTAAAIPFWAIYERLLPAMGLRSALRSYV